MSSWDPATSPGTKQAQLPVGFGCPVGKRKADVPISQRCWSFPPALPTVLAGTQPSWEELVHPKSCPSQQSRCTGVPPAPPCLLLVCPGCCWAAPKGQQRSPLLLLTSLFTHLREQSSSFSPPVFPILHSISPQRP